MFLNSFKLTSFLCSFEECLIVLQCFVIISFLKDFQYFFVFLSNTSIGIVHCIHAIKIQQTLNSRLSSQFQVLASGSTWHQTNFLLQINANMFHVFSKIKLLPKIASLHTFLCLIIFIIKRKKLKTKTKNKQKSLTSGCSRTGT